jgi:hypothetical protein
LWAFRCERGTDLIDPGDRDEGESDIAQSTQDAVKSGLVDDGARNYGRTVLFEAEVQPVEPC